MKNKGSSRKKKADNIISVAKGVDIIARNMIGMEERLSANINAVKHDLGSLTMKVNDMGIKLDNVDSRLIRVEVGVGGISDSVEEIDERLNNIENRFDDVEKDTRALKKAVFAK